MRPKNVILNFTDVELQKYFSACVYKLVTDIKRQFAVTTVATILATINMVGYYIFTRVMGEMVVWLAVFNVAFFLVCIGTIMYLTGKFGEDLAMLEAYSGCTTRDVREDIMDYIPAFDGKEYVYLRVLEHVIRKGNEAQILILNEGYYYITDENANYMVPFNDTLYRQNKEILERCGEDVSIAFDFDGAILIDESVN